MVWSNHQSKFFLLLGKRTVAFIHKEIVNWTPWNKLQWNFDRNLYIFIQENRFGSVVWKMAAILSRPQCVITIRPHPMHPSYLRNALGYFCTVIYKIFGVGNYIIVRWRSNGLIYYWDPAMMTSSNGNIFRVTGLLCGEFTGQRWILRTKASDAELWCFPWSE